MEASIDKALIKNICSFGDVLLSTDERELNFITRLLDEGETSLDTNDIKLQFFLGEIE